MTALAQLVVPLLLGYAIGSLPLAALIGRAAGVDVYRAGERNPGSANVWKLAGPRAGALALAADIAKGAVPALVGWQIAGFGVAWLCGLGAIVGHAWPALGRLPGGRAVATAGGVLIVLQPIAAVVAFIGLAVALVTRGRVVAIGTAFTLYPIAFTVLERDVVRLAAVGTLYLVTLLRYVTSRRAPS